MQLQPGQLISAPFLPATAEIKKFELRSGYALLEVVLHDGRQTYKPLRITPDQLAQIEILDRQEAAVAANAEDFFFLIEANRIRLAYQFDPQLAVSISQVDPLPHQIEAVYHYVLNSPRMRFLIADDPGAGKTIIAGLVIKELEYRRMVRRKGRIQRIGQIHDTVQIYNLRYKGSVEDRVRELLSNRLQEIYSLFGQIPDVLEDAWVALALGEKEEAKKIIDALPEENPFELRYTHVEKVDWESCAEVLAAAEKRRVLRESWM